MTNKSKVSKSAKQPIITVFIILINVLVFIFIQHKSVYYVSKFGLNPASINYYTLLTNSFIHEGIFHLFSNIALFLIFGSYVEKELGKTRFLLFFFGSCIFSSLLHIGIVHATLPEFYINQIIIGLSGAVAGVMGFFAVRYHKLNVKLWSAEIPVMVFILLWLSIQLGFGTLGLYQDSIFGLDLKRVGFWSHLGGFGFGIGIAWVMGKALIGEKEFLLKNASIYFDTQDYLNASSTLETLIKYDPSCAEGYAHLGKVWYYLNERTQSVDYYKTAIDLYLSLGNEDMAYETKLEMEQCWHTEHLSPEVRFRIATYLEEINLSNEALSEFLKIAKESPESPEAQMSLIKAAHLKAKITKNPKLSNEIVQLFNKKYKGSEWEVFFHNNKLS